MATRGVNAMYCLAMSFGFGNLMYVLIVLHQGWHHDFRRDEQIVRQVGLLLLFCEVLPQALLQFYVTVVDRSSPEIVASLFIALMGGAAASSMFEISDRPGVHLGSWFFVATVSWTIGSIAHLRCCVWYLS